MIEQVSTQTPFRTGLKFGLGFSIPFVVLYVIAGALINVTSRQASKQLFRDSFITKAYGPNSGLKLNWHKPDRRSADLFVLGQLSNAGADTWEWVKIQVDLYDKSDELVRVCESRSFGPLHPGENRNFSMSCGGSSEDPLPTFERYEIRIVDATYVNEPKPDDDGA